MGIENAMIAMYEEPEAVNDFFAAHTDFKLRLLDKAAYYYKPDIYIHGDDVASAFGLFMSPQVYRKLCNPYEKKLTHAGMEYGLIVEHHVCGKVDEIIPDIVDTGASVWQIAQSMNDLVGIKQKYGDKLCIHGGWDISGDCSRPGASEEVIRAEVRRCIDTYAAGGNYMLFGGGIMGQRDDPEVIKSRQWVSDECKKYSKEFYKK
jgi:uroporphyrinogen-III decarboxylase